MDRGASIEGLNHEESSVRLDNLRMLAEAGDAGQAVRMDSEYVNNHIHTTYSFSPYSPAKAVWMARRAGLSTAGIVDHDSIGGAGEFIEAGLIMGLATTAGLECRADCARTPLAGRRINNPDQKSIAYMAMHGVPHTRLRTVGEYFAPYLAARNRRNRLMTARLSGLLAPYGLALDYDRDVVPLSMQRDGGSITERHILYALAGLLMERYPSHPDLARFLRSDLGLDISPPVMERLMSEENEYYRYDLLGALKSDLVSGFYVDAAEECPDAREAVAFARAIGAIPCYAYLGDVDVSATGDKKRQRFEDDYLELLFQVLADLGFQGVTYMPTRNTEQQLRRVMELCARNGLMQISGEDINSPRQSFICPALALPAYRHLVESTWALIGHELLATEDPDRGFFSPATVAKYPDLQDRIEIYARIGREEALKPARS